MATRREFIKKSSIAGLALGNISGFFTSNDQIFTYESRFIKLKMDSRRPLITDFSTDSLGNSQHQVNPILQVPENENIKYISKIEGRSISYFNESVKDKSPAWTLKCTEKKIEINTKWTAEVPTEPFKITFDQRLNHSTVLGTMADKNELKLPSVLHLPGMGTFRIYCSDPDIKMFYDANRRVDEPFITMALPPADKSHPDITYTFESVAIFPQLDNIMNDPRFDGFRKDYINIFQLNPRLNILANNSASDPCAFTLFLYAEMAKHTPELIEGLSAMNMIRNSLDQYLGGMIGYGQVGYPAWRSIYTSSDSLPSLIIAACYYILDTKDYGWGRENFSEIKAWAVEMIKTDKNNDGIIEYGHSGNSGSWNHKPFQRPANWWDAIGFGHDDAYSNILAYRACALLADVAQILEKNDDQNYLASFAKKLKSNYFKTFYNPSSGLLAGWRSEDGELHDYYFTFVNSMAVCYGLLDKKQSRQIMTTLLNKMNEVGYSNFELGLPGNLIPIADEDYAHRVPRWGYQHFQVYENGGATGCYAYFTIKALYDLDMRKEGDMILLPMMKSYKNSDFKGHCPGSKYTMDWKTWSGECWGYEGYLVDNYLTFLAVLDYKL